MTRLALVSTSPDRVTQPDLIARVVAGDRLAMRELYDAHVGRVRRLAFRLTGDVELAEEVTQDTFVRALSRIAGFRGDCAISTWLHRITVSVALNATRGVRRRQRREADIEEADAHVAEHEHDRVDPLLRERLQRAIDALPDILRVAIVMHDLEGYSHVEIAEVLDIPVGTCRSRLFLARARLRAATIVGAEAIGLHQDLGSIEPGKLADLVVLDANPLESIRNTKQVRMVMKNGRLYDAETLDETYPRQRKLDRMPGTPEKPATAAGIR